MSGQLTPDQLEQVRKGVPVSRFITLDALGAK
jgi:hypothetical protein